MKLKIGDKEYELRLRMLACRNYQKATGKNLLGDNALSEIFGDNKGKEFNADLLLQFIHACICDGLYPAKIELSIDDVAAGLDSSILINESGKFFRFYVKEKLGITDDQVEDLYKKVKEEKEKNQPAPTETGA